VSTVRNCTGVVLLLWKVSDWLDWQYMKYHSAILLQTLRVQLIVFIVILLIVCFTVHCELVYCDDCLALLSSFGQTPEQYVVESSEVFFQIISNSSFPNYPTTINRITGCTSGGQNKTRANGI
jgi:hypothetical protein